MSATRFHLALACGPFRALLRTEVRAPGARLALACGFLLAWTTVVRSQPLTFTTVAGYPGQGHGDGAAASARFSGPIGVAADSAGNLYVADTQNHTIRKIAVAGTVVTLAGLPGLAGSADGTDIAARFRAPRGVAVDSAGNVYVADTGNHTIRQITPAGVVSTLAGSAGFAGSADGTGSSARFNHPEGVATDNDGNVYVADAWNHTIRKIGPGGVVSTLAGLAGTYGSTDGTGSGARFYQPQGITLDSAGNVFVGDTANHTIRKIAAGGAVTTLAGLAGTYGTADGTGASARFYGPAGVSADGAGNIYVADSFGQTIRKVTPGGVVTTLAGAAGVPGSADGLNSAAQFRGPAGVAAVGTNGVVYVADTGNDTIRQLTAAGTDWQCVTLAGSASTGSTDGAGSAARFYWPAGAAVDGSGNVYVADTHNSTIRKVTPTGVVSTLAGSAGSQGTADGTGSSARFYGPQGLAVDGAGNLYVADSLNGTIRKITAGGEVSTLAGTAGIRGSADDTGSAAQFDGPQGLAVDSAGNVYVSDTWNHTIRKITPAGVVSTLAGFAGRSGDIDGGVANIGTNSTRFNCPAGLALDLAGNLYVADRRNHIVRRVTATGVVSTVAGSPGLWGSVDGTNSAARFNQPTGVAVDTLTNVYVLDSGNHTIRRLVPEGTNWVVSTVAGMAGASGSSDGAGAAARFDHPAALALAADGTLYVADTGNSTLRQGAWITIGPATILAQPQSQTVSQGASPSFTVSAAGTAPLYYQWRLYGTNIPGATAASYTRVNAQPADAGPYSVFVTNELGTALSSDAWLTVVVPPAITTQPLSQNVAQGADVTFDVEASGSAPFSFQWFFNGGAIPGATAGSYTRANAQATDSGSYSVAVSNPGGTATSSNAVLLVIALPEVTLQPLNQVLNPGNLASLTVAATGSAPLAWQWQWHGTNLPGATDTRLAFNSVTTNQNGPYQAVVTNPYGAATSQVATLTVVPTFQPAGLAPIWTLAPGSRPYLTVNSLPYERGMAYNPANGHLLVVNRTTPSVHVLDAATGADLNQLSASGIAGGTYLLLMIGVADDGAAYAGNLTTTSANPLFTLYRWANDSPGTAPTVAYTGNPTPGNSQRYGDTLDVRGAGANTQIILGSRSSTNVILFTTTDGATFSANNITVADAPARSFGLGIAFGTAGTIWGEDTTLPLRQATYNLVAGTGTTLQTYGDPPVPSAVGPIGVSTQLNLLAAINVGSANNHLRLYDLSPALTNGTPALIATQRFPTDNDNSGTGTGAVDFGPGTVYALCANNGLIALQIVPPAQPGRFDSIGLLPEGWAHLAMSGTPGSNYLLQFTTNWAAWADLATLSGSNGLFYYSDPLGPAAPQRFYRLRISP